jgi:hypothetical protein
VGRQGLLPLDASGHKAAAGSLSRLVVRRASVIGAEWLVFVWHVVQSFEQNSCHGQETRSETRRACNF